MNQMHNEGDYYRIEVDSTHFFYGRLFLQQTLCVYNYIQQTPKLDIQFEVLNNQPKLFYVPIADSVLKNNSLIKIGNLPLSETDILEQPPTKWINIANPDDCILLYPDGREVRATREMCIGLEDVGSWSYIHIIKRLKNYIESKKSK